MIRWGTGGRLDMDGWASACFASQENRPRPMPEPPVGVIGQQATCLTCGAVVMGVATGVTVVGRCPLCPGATGAKGSNGQEAGEKSSQ